MTDIALLIAPDDMELVTAGLWQIDGVHVTGGGKRVQTSWGKRREKVEEQANRLKDIFKLLKIDPEVAGAASEQSDRFDPETLNKELELAREEIFDWKEKAEKLDRRVENLRAEKEEKAFPQRAGLSLERIQKLKFLDMTWGWIPSGQRKRIKLPVLKTRILIVPLFERDQSVFLVGVAEKDRLFILHRILKSAFFEPVRLDPTKKLSRTDPTEIEEKIEALENQKRETIDRGRKTEEKWRKKLLPAWKYIEKQLEKSRFFEKFSKAGQHYLIRLRAPEGQEERIFEVVKENATCPHAIILGGGEIDKFS